MKRTSRFYPKAFTITELLVVIVVLGILIALLLPMASKMLDRARATKCVSQLRVIGTIVNSYAADNNMKLSFFRDGSPTSGMWYSKLKTYAELSDEDARRLFRCPSVSMDVKSTKDTWYCYGFRLGKLGSDDPGGRVVEKDTDKGINRGFFEFSIHAVPQPSKYFIMADTLTSDGLQTFRIIPPDLYSGGGIHIRHNHCANVLFLDAHVEVLDLRGLGTLGFTKVLNEEGHEVDTITE